MWFGAKDLQRADDRIWNPTRQAVVKCRGVRRVEPRSDTWAAGTGFFYEALLGFSRGPTERLGSEATNRRNR
jgi:hypothetical protein